MLLLFCCSSSSSCDIGSKGRESGSLKEQWKMGEVLGDQILIFFYHQNPHLMFLQIFAPKAWQCSNKR